LASFVAAHESIRVGSFQSIDKDITQNGPMGFTSGSRSGRRAWEL
jgi:hypothetical protein